MADCQLVKSLPWSSLPFALAFLFISIPTKCFLLYYKAKLRPIFTLLGEQLLESKLDHSCNNAISLCITIARHQHQQSLFYQWEEDSRRLRINRVKWSIYSRGTIVNVARYVFIFPRFSDNPPTVTCRRLCIVWKRLRCQVVGNKSTFCRIQINIFMPPDMLQLMFFTQSSTNVYP